MKFLSVLALSVVLFIANAAHAAAPVKQPDLVSFGAGYFDFDKGQHGTERNRQSGDVRLEYRWGTSLLPMISPWFKSWDSSVQFHPFLGSETTTRGSLYGLGGWDMDWYISKHVVFTWNEGVGFYYRANGPRMGSFLQFRSQAEFGWQFQNNIRTTLQFSHISDARITFYNPGAEILGLYVHIPTSMLFGRK